MGGEKTVVRVRIRLRAASLLSSTWNVRKKPGTSLPARNLALTFHLWETSLPERGERPRAWRTFLIRYSLPSQP